MKYMVLTIIFLVACSPVIESNSSTNVIRNSSNITIQELSLHNVATDCWINYEGIIYDITSFLPNHPGGVKAIAKYCGSSEEFQKAFENRHGNDEIEILMKQPIVGILSE